MMDWIGKTLGRVHIESRIARGGMATVYLGTHTTLQRKVAVKILRNSFPDDPHPLERFEREAQAVARLRHPNIVQVFDFDTVEDQPYIVMEYVPGPSLSTYLSALNAKSGHFSLALINRLLSRIAGALQYAHENGVVHRDVKPGNILLTSRSIQVIPGETLPLDLEPVLTDFGLVRLLNSSRQTATGLITGTPAYMSPEQAQGQATDGRTDVYSLGIVLYELLSGNVPFDGETTISILLKHMNEAPAPVPGLSPALQRVLDRALAKHPADRFQQPEEFSAAFSTALERTSDATTLVTIPQALGAAKANRAVTSAATRMNWAPALLAGALILLVGASLLLNRTPPAAPSEVPTTPPIPDTPFLSIPVTLGPASILQFRDGNAILDQATLIAQAMPAPPADSQYRVSLINGEERLPLGILRVDGSGKGELTFKDPAGDNLVAAYDRVEITVEPRSGTDPTNTADIAYAYTLPEPGLAYLRGLIVSFRSTPEQVGLIHGLARNAKLLDKAATQMRTEYENGDEELVQETAESIMNILVGDQSPDHKDWNGDRQISDPGDGYGFLLNGDHLGYIQAIYSQADYAVNSPAASRNMIVNGENVKVCAQNLARWAPQLRDQVSLILNAAASSNLDSPVQESAELANRLLEGIDLDENGTTDPVSGECGVLTAYEFTYRMADMPLLPVNPLEAPVASSPTITTSPTVTPPLFHIASPTKPRENNNQPQATAFPNNNPPPEDPIDEPPPPVDNHPKPTKRPRPTDRPNPSDNPNPGGGNPGGP